MPHCSFLLEQLLVSLLKVNIHITLLGVVKVTLP